MRAASFRQSLLLTVLVVAALATSANAQSTRGPGKPCGQGVPPVAAASGLTFEWTGVAAKGASRSVELFELPFTCWSSRKGLADGLKPRKTIAVATGAKSAPLKGKLEKNRTYAWRLVTRPAEGEAKTTPLRCFTVGKASNPKSTKAAAAAAGLKCSDFEIAKPGSKAPAEVPEKRPKRCAPAKEDPAPKACLGCESAIESRAGATLGLALDDAVGYDQFAWPRAIPIKLLGTDQDVLRVACSGCSEAFSDVAVADYIDPEVDYHWTLASGPGHLVAAGGDAPEPYRSPAASREGLALKAAIDGLEVKRAAAVEARAETKAALTRTSTHLGATSGLVDQARKTIEELRAEAKRASEAAEASRAEAGLLADQLGANERIASVLEARLVAVSRLVRTTVPRIETLQRRVEEKEAQREAAAAELGAVRMERERLRARLGDVLHAERLEALAPIAKQLEAQATRRQEQVCSLGPELRVALTRVELFPGDTEGKARRNGLLGELEQFARVCGQAKPEVAPGEGLSFAGVVRELCKSRPRPGDPPDHVAEPLERFCLATDWAFRAMDMSDRLARKLAAGGELATATAEVRAQLAALADEEAAKTDALAKAEDELAIVRRAVAREQAARDEDADELAMAELLEAQLAALASQHARSRALHDNALMAAGLAGQQVEAAQDALRRAERHLADLRGERDGAQSEEAALEARQELHDEALAKLDEQLAAKRKQLEGLDRPAPAAADPAGDDDGKDQVAPTARGQVVWYVPPSLAALLDAPAASRERSALKAAEAKLEDARKALWRLEDEQRGLWREQIAKLPRFLSDLGRYRALMAEEAASKAGLEAAKKEQEALQAAARKALEAHRDDVLVAMVAVLDGDLAGELKAIAADHEVLLQTLREREDELHAVRTSEAKRLEAAVVEAKGALDAAEKAYRAAVADVRAQVTALVTLQDKMNSAWEARDVFEQLGRLFEIIERDGTREGLVLDEDRTSGTRSGEQVDAAVSRIRELEGRQETQQDLVGQRFEDVAAKRATMARAKARYETALTALDAHRTKLADAHRFLWDARGRVAANRERAEDFWRSVRHAARVVLATLRLDVSTEPRADRYLAAQAAAAFVATNGPAIAVVERRILGEPYAAHGEALIADVAAVEELKELVAGLDAQREATVGAIPTADGTRKALPQSELRRVHERQIDLEARLARTLRDKAALRAELARAAASGKAAQDALASDQIERARQAVVEAREALRVERERVTRALLGRTKVTVKVRLTNTRPLEGKVSDPPTAEVPLTIGWSGVAPKVALPAVRSTGGPDSKTGRGCSALPPRWSGGAKHGGISQARAPKQLWVGDVTWHLARSKDADVVDAMCGAAGGQCAFSGYAKARVIGDHTRHPREARATVEADTGGAGTVLGAADSDVALFRAPLAADLGDLDGDGLLDCSKQVVLHTAAENGATQSVDAPPKGTKHAITIRAGRIDWPTDAKGRPLDIQAAPSEKVTVRARILRRIDTQVPGSDGQELGLAGERVTIRVSRPDETGDAWGFEGGEREVEVKTDADGWFESTVALSARPGDYTVDVAWRTGCGLRVRLWTPLAVTMDAPLAPADSAWFDLASTLWKAGTAEELPLEKALAELGPMERADRGAPQAMALWGVLTDRRGRPVPEVGFAFQKTGGGRIGVAASEGRSGGSFGLARSVATRMPAGGETLGFGVAVADDVSTPLVVPGPKAGATWKGAGTFQTARMGRRDARDGAFYDLELAHAVHAGQPFNGLADLDVELLPTADAALRLPVRLEGVQLAGVVLDHHGVATAGTATWRSAAAAAAGEGDATELPTTGTAGCVRYQDRVTLCLTELALRARSSARLSGWAQVTFAPPGWDGVTSRKVPFVAHPDPARGVLIELPSAMPDVPLFPGSAVVVERGGTFALDLSTVASVGGRPAAWTGLALPDARVRYDLLHRSPDAPSEPAWGAPKEGVPVVTHRDVDWALPEAGFSRTLAARDLAVPIPTWRGATLDAVTARCDAGAIVGGDLSVAGPVGPFEGALEAAVTFDDQHVQVAASTERGLRHRPSRATLDVHPGSRIATATDAGNKRLGLSHLDGAGALRWPLLDGVELLDLTWGIGAGGLGTSAHGFSQTSTWRGGFPVVVDSVAASWLSRGPDPLGEDALYDLQLGLTVEVVGTGASGRARNTHGPSGTRLDTKLALALDLGRGVATGDLAYAANTFEGTLELALATPPLPRTDLWLEAASTQDAKSGALHRYARGHAAWSPEPPGAALGGSGVHFAGGALAVGHGYLPAIEDLSGAPAPTAGIGMRLVGALTDPGGGGVLRAEIDAALGPAGVRLGTADARVGLVQDEAAPACDSAGVCGEARLELFEDGSIHGFMESTTQLPATDAGLVDAAGRVRLALEPDGVHHLRSDRADQATYHGMGVGQGVLDVHVQTARAGGPGATERAASARLRVDGEVAVGRQMDFGILDAHLEARARPVRDVELRPQASAEAGIALLKPTRFVVDGRIDGSVDIGATVGPLASVPASFEATTCYPSACIRLGGVRFDAEILGVALDLGPYRMLPIGRCDDSCRHE